MKHEPADSTEWDEGAWLVCHKGTPRSWWTSRGTEMVARLVFTEIVGTVAVPVGDRYDGPQGAPGGCDGSGYMGTHDIDAADQPRGSTWRPPSKTYLSTAGRILAGV